MEILTVVVGAVVVFFIYLIVDTINRNNKNFAKFEKLYLETRQVLDKIQEEQRLELLKERQKLYEVVIDTKIGDLPVISQEKAKEVILGESPVKEDVPAETNELDLIVTIPAHSEVLPDVEKLKEEQAIPEDFTIEHIKDREFTIAYDETYFLPCLDKEDLPIYYKLTNEVAKVVRREYGLPENNSRLVKYDEVKAFLKKHNVKINISYPKIEVPKTPLDAFPNEATMTFLKKQTKEEIEKERAEKLAEAVNPNMHIKLVRYKDGETIVQKECGHIELYRAYIKKFGDTLLTKNAIPTGEQFIEWYNEAIDEFSKLIEVDKTRGL